MGKIGDEVFKVPMTWNRGEDMILEFFVCKTNEINPNRNIRELGIVIYEGNEEKRKSKEFRQFDNNNDFDVEEIEKLIKYLQKVKRHIKTFNANSKRDVQEMNFPNKTHTHFKTHNNGNRI